MACGVDGDPGALVIEEQESAIDQDSATTPPLGQKDWAVLAQIRMEGSVRVCLISNTYI